MSSPVTTPGPARTVTTLDRLWPDTAGSAGRLTPLLAAAAGLMGALLLVGSRPGIGVVATGLAVALAAATAAGSRPASSPTSRPASMSMSISAHEVTYGLLALVLLSAAVLRDAPWFVTLALLGATGLGSFALAPGRSLVAGLLSGVSLPLAGLRALPWLRRGVAPRIAGLAGNGLRVARIVVLAGVLLLVFGSLFAAADAVFARLLPSPDLGLLPVRLAAAVVVAGFAVGGAYLATAPPRWDLLAPVAARPVRVAEWLVPITVLDGLFATFVGVQLTVLFGGHGHVLETSGLTYAEYARAGFGHLLVVTLLTLSVVAGTVRWAPKETPRQRSTLRVLLGLLCALTLVVVGSALFRLHLYEEAFGFTRLRLFMNAFETWLGVLVVLVLLAGIRLRAAWLPRAVVASAAAGLVALGAINPDAYVAERNIERWRATGAIDLFYLQQLSADAVPAVDRLPEPLRSCALTGMPAAAAAGEGGGPGGWNLARSRAADLLAARPVAPVPDPATCTP